MTMLSPSHQPKRRSKNTPNTHLKSNIHGYPRVRPLGPSELEEEGRQQRSCQEEDEEQRHAAVLLRGGGVGQGEERAAPPPPAATSAAMPSSPGPDCSALGSDEAIGGLGVAIGKQQQQQGVQPPPPRNATRGTSSSSSSRGAASKPHRRVGAVAVVPDASFKGAAQGALAALEQTQAMLRERGLPLEVGGRSLSRSLSVTSTAAVTTITTTSSSCSLPRSAAAAKACVSSRRCSPAVRWWVWGWLQALDVERQALGLKTRLFGPQVGRGAAAAAEVVAPVLRLRGRFGRACGVGCMHQSGVVERSVCELVRASNLLAMERLNEHADSHGCLHLLNR